MCGEKVRWRKSRVSLVPAFPSEGGDQQEKVLHFHEQLIGLDSETEMEYSCC